MKRPLVVLTLAAAFLVPTSRASAQFSQSWSPFCSPTSAVNFCASASFGFDNLGNVTLTVTNLSDGGAVYGGASDAKLQNIGLYNILGSLATTTNFQAMDGATDVTSFWHLSQGTDNGSGVTNNLDLVFDTYTTGKDKLPVLPSHTITFTFDATNLSATEAQLYIKSQSANGSSECMTGNTSAINGLASCIPVTSTPEPASLALLGTGLVGIYGAVRRRRRSA